MSKYLCLAALLCVLARLSLFGHVTVIVFHFVQNVIILKSFFVKVILKLVNSIFGQHGYVYINY